MRVTPMLRGGCSLVLIVVLGACGGGGLAEDATDPAPPTQNTAPTTAPHGDEAPTDTAETAAPGGEAGELPAFLGDFERVCTTQVGFPGAAEYDGEPGIHPVALFEEFTDEEDNFLETSRQLPAAWVVKQDTDYEDNSELAAIELIGCSDRVAQTPNGTKCDFDSDGKEVTLELVDARYVVTVYEATTGEEVTSGKVSAKSTDCPSFVSFEEGQTELVNEPTDAQIIKLLRPAVDL